MSWKQKLAAMGFDESNMPPSVKKAVNDYNKIQAGVEKIKQKLSSTNLSDDEKEELEENLDYLQGSLDEAQQNIENKVNMYEKNKEHYKASGEKLKAARAGKAKSGDNKAEPVKKDGGAEPPQPPQPPKEEPKPAEFSEVTEKKGGIGAGTIIIGGLLLVLSFGAYNYFAKNE